MKKTNKNKNFTNSDHNAENYIKNLELSLANLEQLGALFLSIGYFTFFIGAKLDVLKILGINNTGKSPDKTFFEGQSLTVIGYILLYIVSKNRVNVDMLKEEYLGKSEGIFPHEILARAYALSVFANSIRLEAFSYLYALSLENDDSQNNNSDS